jgi:trehalose 6-phosphate synthase
MTVVVSNRGPYRFVARPDGTFEARIGAGGVASSLGPLLTSGAAGETAAWIAAAVDDDDRAAVRAGAAEAPGISLTLLDIDPRTYRLYYDVVSNSVLWFLHHGLFDLPRRPQFDHRFREAWDAYVEVNHHFADAVAEVAVPDSVVLVQDYQLALVPGLLRDRRTDLRIAHFTHTSFCGPNSIRVLPTDIAEQICASMATVPCGFHSVRWASAYTASVREILGSDAQVPPTFVSALGPDPEALRELSASPEAATAGAELAALVGDRALLLRVDRIEPSKNIVRGFAAYDTLLADHPEWRERVVFLARLNASRETMPEYLAYRNEVEQAAQRVNEQWATPTWQPVVVDTRDDFPSTVAALQRYDVLLVNPIKDGLNLVAKEGPILNECDGVLCLSPDAGAWDELGDAALRIHPYDVSQGAEVLHRALGMSATERTERSERLHELAGARTPRDWLDDQLRAAGATASW